MSYKNIAGTFFGLVTKHACDGQTDRTTTSKTALAWLRRAVKKIDKSPYLSNGFTDHREIWHGVAFWQGLAGYRWALPRISGRCYITMDDLCRWTFVDGHVVDSDHLNTQHPLKLHPLYQRQWVQRPVCHLHRNNFTKFTLKRC